VRLVTECAEGDLGGVEQPGAIFVLDCANEHSVRGAGDKVADALIAGERRHGGAVSTISKNNCVGIVFKTCYSFALEAAPPSRTTPLNGGIRYCAGIGNGVEQA
jgi:hypothetical protein